MKSLGDEEDQLAQSLELALSQWRRQSASRNEEIHQLRALLAEKDAEILALRCQTEDGVRLRQENEDLRGRLGVIPLAALPVERSGPTSNPYEHLLRDSHLKQAKIALLEQQLLSAQAKIRKWQLKRTFSSSPTSSPHPGQSSRTDRPAEERANGRCADAKHTLQINEEDQVPEPPAKRRRISQNFLLETTAQEIPGSVSTSRDPLSIIDGNKIALPGTSGALKKSTCRNCPSDRGSTAIAISEDGEGHSCRPKEKADKLMSPAVAANSSAFRRLGDLMSASSPSRPKLLKPSWTIAPADEKTTGVGSPENPDSAKRNLKPFLPPRRQPPNGAEDSEPYRARPLQRLSLEHFKINPRFNAGVEHAFVDVIRGREGRKCLPGCTRPECCGDKFRALAKTLPHLNKPWLRPCDDKDENICDDDLLLGFFGIGSEEKIKNMTSIARESALLEAKTRWMADKYGKMHRQAFDRAKSPPGFWRTDMPGTQEEREDRERARERERKEVERRYTDACRQGGRWIFADE